MGMGPPKRPLLGCPDFGFPRPSLDAPKESSEPGSGMQVVLKPILHTTLWETTQKLLTWTTIQMSQVMLTYSTFSGTIMILAPKTKGNTCLLYFTTTKNKKNLHYKQKKITTEIASATEFTDAEDYHQKYMLQHHPWLLESLDIHPGDFLIKSHVAARLNGYIGGYGNIK